MTAMASADPDTSKPQTASELSTCNLPAKPRFVRDVVVVPFGEGFIVDGAGPLRVFRGTAARDLLPALIPLMDGTRTSEQLESALPGIPGSEVRAAISELFKFGMIEDYRRIDGAEERENSETQAFLRRHIGVMGINRSGSEAYGRLKASEVVLVAPGKPVHTEMLRLMLEKNGVGLVTPLDREVVTTWTRKCDGPLAQSLVLVLSFGDEDSEWQSKFDDWCFDHGLTWLRTAMDVKRGYADLGPLFRGGQRPCYRCFHSIHGNTSCSRLSDIGEIPAHAWHSWLAMIAIEVTYLLSGIAPSVTDRGLGRYGLEHWNVHHLRLARIPGCPRCRPIVSKSPGPPVISVNRDLIDTALVFEDYVGLDSRPPRSAQAEEDLLRMGSALSLDAKRLPNCKQIPISRGVQSPARPMLDALLLDPVRSRQPLTAEELGRILLMTAGIRESRSGREILQRWAATAGNLGSVELFVAVHHVKGLHPGFYFYQPRENSLACFQPRGGQLKVEEFTRRALFGNLSNLPDALVVFTGAFHRIARKYGPFGYRLVNLDAGAALSQMELLARSSDVQPQVVVQWADDLIEKQLNLDSFSEQVTALVALSRVADAVPSVQGGPLPKSGSMLHHRISAKTPAEFRDLELDEVVRLLYRESRAIEARSPYCGLRTPVNSLDAEARSKPIPLSQALSGGRSVDDVLSRRTSRRQFGNEPVSLEQLATMLNCAERGDVGDWGMEDCGTSPLTFLVLVSKVDGLVPAVYTYHADMHALVASGDELSHADRTELFVQDEFALAPLVVWIAGNLSAECARLGAFGHRRLLLRAGAAGHRLWMAALATGLCGSLVAGVVPGAARRLLGLDGYGQASLLALAVGHRAHNQPSVPDVLSGTL